MIVSRQEILQYRIDLPPKKINMFQFMLQFSARFEQFIHIQLLKRSKRYKRSKIRANILSSRSQRDTSVILLYSKPDVQI